MNINITNSKSGYHEFLSPNDDVNGLMIISHGMAEHIGRYKWLISQLNADGYHVIASDHRGHGANILNGSTPGLFSLQDGWNKVSNDLLDTIIYAQNKFKNIKTYLIGHSMGSWIALSILDKNVHLDGLVLTGSSKISNQLIYIQKSVIKAESILKGPTAVSSVMDKLTIRKFNDQYKPNRTPNDWISRDKDSVDNYTADPLCGFQVTNSLWNDLSNGLLEVFKKNFYLESNKKIPILIMSGKFDAASSNGKMAISLHKFLDSIFMKTSIILMDDARHEVFTELNKLEAYKKFKLFIMNL